MVLLWLFCKIPSGCGLWSNCWSSVFRWDALPPDRSSAALLPRREAAGGRIDPIIIFYKESSHRNGKHMVSCRTEACRPLLFRKLRLVMLWLEESLHLNVAQQQPYLRAGFSQGIRDVMVRERPKLCRKDNSAGNLGAAGRVALVRNACLGGEKKK